jgi:hypothetical protein
LRKLSTAQIWQQDKRTDGYMIIMNYVRKLIKKQMRKRGWERPKTFFEIVSEIFYRGEELGSQTKHHTTILN